MMRLTLSYLLRVLLVAAVVVPLTWLLMFFALTGHWLPIRERGKIVETRSCSRLDH
jgi:hypothetical protein